MQTEERARAAVVTWAKEHFNDELVEVLEISYDKDEMNWTATLSIFTSADDPTVTFIIDDLYGIHIQTVEY